MKPRIGFIISIFLICLISSFPGKAQQKDCRKIDVAVEVNNSVNGQQGSIKVTTTNSEIKFTLHLLGKGLKNNKNNQMDITTGKIENIPPGTYDLVIHVPEGGYCSETRKVTVN